MEKVKKYIFPIVFLAFIIAIIQLITSFTQSSTHNQEAKMIDGWKHITFDHIGNAYYIDISTITVDKRESGNLRFHAVYRKVYSDKGREAIAESYSGSGVDVSMMSDIDYELETVYFKDTGDKYFTGADCKFYKADGTEIPALDMKVTVDESTMEPIPGKSIVEILFDYAYSRLPEE